MTIMRTQGGPGLKLRSNFMEPYKIDSELRHDRCVVERVGDHERPFRTSTEANYMKPWPNSQSLDFGSDLEDETEDS